MLLFVGVLVLAFADASLAETARAELGSRAPCETPRPSMLTSAGYAAVLHSRAEQHYERHARKAAAFVGLAMIRLMLRRLSTSP
jgi:hypothetical protein